MAEELLCQDFGLRPLWDALFDIYAEFAKVCDKYQLRYYAFAGTLLGAIRHNGFIPWDDDLDVAMPRPDYEKFIEIAKDELPNYLKFVYWKNTPEFNYLFGKIQDSRKDAILKLEKSTGRMLSNGIYIDIFPLDGYPRSELYRTFIKYRDLVLLPIERFHLYAWGQLSNRGRRAWIIGSVLSMFVPWLRKQHQFMSLHERVLMRTPYENSALVSDVGLRYNVLSQPVLPKEAWGEPMLHSFDGKQISIQHDPIEYLQQKFGDYMKLPPKESRHPSHQYAWRCAWWLGPTNQSEQEKRNDKI